MNYEWLLRNLDELVETDLEKEYGFRLKIEGQVTGNATKWVTIDYKTIQKIKSLLEESNGTRLPK